MLHPQVVQQLLLDARRALVRHHRKSLAVFGAVVALTFVGLFFMPRSYLSDGRIFVLFGRNMVLDPTATTGQIVGVSETRESELNSLLEVLGSRSLLERVVTAIGPKEVLSGKVPATMPTIACARVKQAAISASSEITPTSANPAMRDSTHQQAVAKLQREVEIYVPRKTNTITVRCRTDSPELAQSVVAALMAAYLDEHVRVHHTSGSFEFFQQQAKSFELQWQQASSKLRLAKNRMGVVTIDGKQKSLEGQITEIETKLLQNAAEIAASEARIESLVIAIAKLPQWLNTVQQEGPNSAADAMRTELYKLQAMEQEKSAKFTANHPQLIAIRQQMVDLKRILDEQEPVRKQDTQAVNPARQALELQLLTERSLVDSLQGRAVELAKQQQYTQRELEQLNGQGVQLAELQRNVDLAEASYRSAAEKLEQARTNEKLDKEKITNLSIAQPASYIAKPLGPRKAYVLALGMMVGLLGAVGIAIAAAWFDPLLKTPGDIADHLELPLLGEIPAEQPPLVLAS